MVVHVVIIGQDIHTHIAANANLDSSPLTKALMAYWAVSRPGWKLKKNLSDIIDLHLWALHHIRYLNYAEATDCRACLSMCTLWGFVCFQLQWERKSAGLSALIGTMLECRDWSIHHGENLDLSCENSLQRQQRTTHGLWGACQWRYNWNHHTEQKPAGTSPMGSNGINFI